MMAPQIRLSIEGKPGRPRFQVVTREDGKGFGNLQVLGVDEVQPLARWIGQHGGKLMLDEFEVPLINAGLLRVSPMNTNGDPLNHSHEALEIWRTDDGSAQILWQRLEACVTCDGAGHKAKPGQPVSDEDICGACDGAAKFATVEILTDMDGLLIEDTTQ